MLNHTPAQANKHQALLLYLTAEFQRLIADRECRFGFGLFGADTHPPAGVAGSRDLLPTQLLDIAYTQADKARK